ncbi:putative ubiquitin carboxyl-terminal hydrolase creB [Neonectria ditissima]|uniref:Ubiquitin carboxyl-terminal hydrolase n=1 Tax=Neonectria ditissima TaxID=78410 RepID=A0A0P7AQ70_9HYPO|nr:putative ubiquitin carboxyl-terminal hydrolase creB [Neonectria ditissima]
MASFFNKIKGSGTASSAPSKDAVSKKKEEPVLDLTPLEKMLQNAPPLREDGTDRFFGLENFGNTCYCNSIVQALFYSESFRENVIKYPPYSPSHTPNGTRPKVNVTIRPPPPPNPVAQQNKQKGLSTSQVIRQRQALNHQLPGQVGVRPEDKPDTPEYKKKQAMLKGPILELAQENSAGYGMEESTFTGLKDIFLALIESNTHTGVLSPQRFLEIFKRDNEMFRNSMHQDAHEFYGLVLNDVIANVEATARKMQLQGDDGLAQSVQTALGSAVTNQVSGVRSPGTGWVHDIFEGVLTSETKCLTCETASQRDETFLDLSIDLEEHSSVTSCLRKFSAEEMLCERNKFHCDHCGGLQEAEKRMKVKRLPKVLTLHLKRFKYTEDYSRLQKLFHRVVYPYHLRMFNTTDDAADPDRLYELYAVVVHIGGNAYHGHYVSIVKTKDRGWVLFDDEMVEPVDKHFVRNFFGDKPGMATAYVLFYQETTFEKVREEQEREGMEEVKLANEAANLAQENSDKAESLPLKRQMTQPVTPIRQQESLASLAHATTAPPMTAPAVPSTAPSVAPETPVPAVPAIPAVPAVPAIPVEPTVTSNGLRRADTSVGLRRSDTPNGLRRADTSKETKEEKKREKKQREAAEKAEKLAEKERKKEREEQAKLDEKKRRDEQAKITQARRNEQDELQRVLEASKKSAAQENGERKKENGAAHSSSFLDRSKRGSKSMSKKSFSLFHHKDKATAQALGASQNGDTHDKHEKLKDRLSFGLGRKKSTNLLSST